MSLVTFGEHTVLLSFTVEGLKVISNVMRIIFMTRFVSKRVILLFSQANEYVASTSVTVLHPASLAKFYMKILLISFFFSTWEWTSGNLEMMMKLWQKECVTMSKLNMELKFTIYDIHMINLKTWENSWIKSDVRERRKEICR